MVRQCVDQQSGSTVAAKFISRSMVTPDAVMAEVNIMHNLRHAGLVLPTCVCETDAAFIIVLPL